MIVNLWITFGAFGICTMYVRVQHGMSLKAAFSHYLSYNFVFVFYISIRIYNMV